MTVRKEEPIVTAVKFAGALGVGLLLFVSNLSDKLEAEATEPKPPPAGSDSAPANPPATPVPLPAPEPAAVEPAPESNQPEADATPIWPVLTRFTQLDQVQPNNRCKQFATDAGFMTCPAADVCHLGVSYTCSDGCDPNQEVLLEIRHPDGTVLAARRGLPTKLEARAANLPAGSYEVYMVGRDWPGDVLLHSTTCLPGNSDLVTLEVQVIGC